MQGNIFECPDKYIKEIVDNIRIPLNNRKKFDGKTMAFLFLTKFCDVECAHCFFKSRKNVNDNHSKEYELTEEGLNKVIDFINSSNNGYLSVLGGGEPFNRFDYILKLIKRVKTDRMVLVTSGNWAVTFESAKEKISLIKEALKSREDSLKLVLRISVDKWHEIKIRNENIINILKIMEAETTDNFTVEIHTLDGDNTLNDILNTYSEYQNEDYEQFASDNNEIMKLGYARYTVKLQNGFSFKVGVARKFNSNLKVDLSYNRNLDDIMKAFDDDIEINCYGNPSIVHSFLEKKGLDFLISYNGNVTTWGNDQPYKLNNLYIHNYEEVISRSIDNIISYSFIDKGFKYRENTVNEVNPIAVVKSKAIHIRDYSGNLLFEENSTVLYYAIRVIQDYLKDNVLPYENLNILSEQLKEAINLSNDELIKLFKVSNYSIINQYKEDETKSLVDWEDLMELIRLKHYDIPESSVNEAIQYINLKFGTNYKSIDEFKFSGEEQYIRLLNRISGIAKEAL